MSFQAEDYKSLPQPLIIKRRTWLPDNRCNRHQARAALRCGHFPKSIYNKRIPPGPDLNRSECRIRERAVGRELPKKFCTDFTGI
jgi:hypothetical protein